jgi:hypothetical protein
MADEEWDWAKALSELPGVPPDSGYYAFARSVKHEARYVHEQAAREFMAKVLATLPQRGSLINEGEVLCRAQRGFSMGTVEGEGFEREMAHSPERMAPTVEHSIDGRVSPRGIPCLYLASNMKTAVAEVRPWVGSYVSLAQFKLVRRCKVVDCRSTKDTELDRDQAALWSDIAYAFSEPVSPEEPHLEYVPTQVLAETFRSQGFDGIQYESLLSKGTNIALFDTTSAELINCGLHKVQTVSFEFELSGDPYYILNHYPEMAARIATPSQEPEDQEVIEPAADQQGIRPLS